VGLDLVGLAPQRFNPPIEVGFRSLGDLGAAGAPVAATMFLQGPIVTLRFGTGHQDNLLAPPLNLLTNTGNNWLIRLSPEVFTSTVLEALEAGLHPLPAGTTVEDSPEVGWGEHDGTWRVSGSVGVEKEDACPGLLGDVDISVAIDVSFTPTPNAALSVLDLALRLESDASDWDSLRCWLGSVGGLISLGLAFVSLPVGFFAGVGTLLYAANKVKEMAGAALADTNLGPRFQKVGSDETSVSYAGQLPLPALGRIDQATTGPHGLVVMGMQAFLPADRVVTYTPDTLNLKTRWHQHYVCKEHAWHSSLLIEGVGITDTASIGSQEYAKVPITVFSTSSVKPADSWKIEPAAGATLEQYVMVSRKSGGILNGSFGGRLYVHTSSGIRSYDIDPIPLRLAPSNSATSIAEVNCRTFARDWTKLEQLVWLVDPPAWDLGLAPLRQWQLTVSEVPEGASITLRRQRGGRAYGAPISVTASHAASLAIEVITDAGTQLALEHTLSTPPEALLQQRWLLPQRMIHLGAPARQIGRERDQLAVATALGVTTHDLRTGRQSAHISDVARLERREGRLYAVENHSYRVGESSNAGVEARTIAKESAFVPPFSVTLRDGRVAGAWEDKLVIARVWGTDRRERSV
jgi:hypothetical protein